MIARAGVLRLALLVLGAAPIVRVAAQRPAPGAPIDMAGFRYSRSVPPGDGLTVVTLDAPSLAHSRVDDIRIVDGRRRQVPYVIEPSDDALELALPRLELTSPRTNVDQILPTTAAKRTWYRARLPFAGLPHATLRIKTNERIFRRDIAAVTSHAARDAAPYVATPRFQNESWSHDDPATDATPLDIDLGARFAADSLFVLVDDGDNQKLPITEATIRLRTYRLRFFRDSGQTLRVLYGRADLAAPRYDLALVAERLRDSSAISVTLGPERAIEDASGRIPTVVFWSVLIGTVVVLLALIARLLSGSGSDAATRDSAGGAAQGP